MSSSQQNKDKDEIKSRLNELFDAWNTLKQIIASKDEILKESNAYQILLGNIDEEEKWYFTSISFNFSNV